MLIFPGCNPKYKNRWQVGLPGIQIPIDALVAALQITSFGYPSTKVPVRVNSTIVKLGFSVFLWPLLRTSDVFWLLVRKRDILKMGSWPVKNWEISTRRSF